MNKVTGGFRHNDSTVKARVAGFNKLGFLTYDGIDLPIEFIADFNNYQAALVVNGQRYEAGDALKLKIDENIYFNMNVRKVLESAYYELQLQLQLRKNSFPKASEAAKELLNALRESLGWS